MSLQHFPVFLMSVACLAAGQKVFKNGDVRLVKGTSPTAGVLNVFYNGNWGPVCDDGEDVGVGRVACRNLNTTLVAVRESYTLSGSSSFLLDDVVCNGTEANLAQCRHSAWNSANCGYNEHLYIICADPGRTCDQLYAVDGDNYTCTCETGYKLAKDGRSCEVNGFTVDCTTSGMMILLDRNQFFFLPDSLTLTNTSCTSQSNSTHIWLYTDYNACSTVRKMVGNDVVYKNVVVEPKTIDGQVRFFDKVKIPFECRLLANQTLTQTIRPVASKLIMRVENTGQLSGTFVLLSSATDEIYVLAAPYLIKQGHTVYAKLSSGISGIAFSAEYCNVQSGDGTTTLRLIHKGKPVNSIAKVLPSNQFRFSYPAFTFASKGNQLNLRCRSSFNISNQLHPEVVDSRLIVTAQELADARSRNSKSESSPFLSVVDTSSGVQLYCTSNSMYLDISPAVVAGLYIEDLRPLKENCGGFRSIPLGNGNYRYDIPLTGCGGVIENNGDTVIFTNSLVYSSTLRSKVKHFSEIVFTYSCTYYYEQTITYTVGARNYSFNAVNKEPASFDISLKVFSDNKFQQLLSNGGAVNISEGKHLFGDIGVISSDPNLQVALNECKVTPTNNVDDPNSHVVIKNGCKTAYGTSVLSPSRFSIQTNSFTNHKGQHVYLHCSVVVCDSSTLARCQRRCAATALPGDAIGRREVDTEPSPEELVNVSAGPFLVK